MLSTAHTDFGKGLNSHAFFKVHDKTTSEDLVQDTFLKTWGYLVRGGKIELMKAFLYHVLNNLIIDEYRKRKFKTASLDVLIENGFEPSGDDFENIFSHLDSKTVIQLVAELPIKYQKVMRMRYTQDLSLKEMSLITGESRNVLAVQVHRGLAKLKVLYEKK